MVLHEAEELETAGFNLGLSIFIMILEDFYKADKGIWRNSSCLLLGAFVSLELL
jgi:hypothetical protein